jgi:CHASE2 domain-containing sensor protein
MAVVTAVPPTPRELFLAAAIAGMMLCGLVSFFLLGRVAERTHVALALLAVLIGAFALLPLFALIGGQVPVLGAGVILGLVGLFKLMNQFEIRPRPKQRR